MAMAKMFAYPPSQHELPHWKFLLRYCVNFPCIDLPGQESDSHHYDTSPSICFHFYHLYARCIVYRRLLLDENNICLLCQQILVFVPPTKQYTRKYFS